MGADITGAVLLSAVLAESIIKVNALAGVVLRKSAQDVVTRAQAAAPVDTGTLRSAIGVLSTTGGAGVTTVSIGPTANYALYVENGTSRMGAQPYMRPAKEAVEPSMVAAMQKIKVI